MSHSGHDLLASRLANILLKLNCGECLAPDALASEFGVHKRTIQRGLLEHFNFLPMEKVEGLFAIDPIYLGRITVRDIERFANLAGLQGFLFFAPLRWLVLVGIAIQRRGRLAIAAPIVIDLASAVLILRRIATEIGIRSTSFKKNQHAR